MSPKIEKENLRMNHFGLKLKVEGKLLEGENLILFTIGFNSSIRDECLNTISYSIMNYYE